MATWRVNNATLLGGEVCSPWQPNHAYSLGARCVCRVAYGITGRRAYVYECTTGGTSHATTEPTWPTSGTVVDNTVTWTCRSPNDGNWDNASCYLFYITQHASPAAGDSILIHNAHAETYGAAYGITGSSTANNWLKIFCVNKATDALSTGAVIENTVGNFTIDKYGYSYGVQYKISSAGQFIFGSTVRAYWILEADGSFDVINLNNASNYVTAGIAPFQSDIINAGILFGYVGNSLGPGGNAWVFRWKGGIVHAPSGLTNLFKVQSILPGSVVSDVDLTQVGSGATATSLITGGTTYPYTFPLFSRCKLPTAAGFTLKNAAWSYQNHLTLSLHHCSAANKTYAFIEDSYQGTVQDETTIVRTGGASDGTTPQSWKMISLATTMDGVVALESPPIVGWTDSTTPKTFTIECIYDSLTNLQDDEIWMEFEYPVNGTDGLGGFVTDRCAPLGIPADQTASTVAWTTTGITNVNKFKLSVTVTPGKAGPITARVCLAKASKTVYIDPMIMES